MRRIYVVTRCFNQSVLLLKITSLAGIYIHIPFCRKACHYCDFHFSTSLLLVDEMVNAIVKEAELMKGYIQEPVETIYFGGGTPSILSPAQLEKITEALYKHFSINGSIEFTLEANPDDLSKSKLKDFASIGVNRLSIGTQSFNDRVLQLLNRSHSVQQAIEAIENSKEVGITNISLDLIYGIPDQNMNQWEVNLDQLTKLQPTHVSCYALTIEERTVFGNWAKKGKLIPKEDKLTHEEYAFMVRYLETKGFEHYEVSNFAQPGYISKHNSSYWLQKSYLGLGPGAHSFNGEERHFTISNNPTYIKGIKNNQSVFSKERLTAKEKITEYILTGIRTKWGIDFKELEEQFGYEITQQHHSYIKSIVQLKLANFVGNRLVLTSEGYFLSDSIALELIPEP